ncbi:UDP-N-acetylmuramoyl-tripeptide--D-alanyl-D-alanine ligase [Bacillaceae bacterium IKA-2]|nr:UDP-N-acetylmuramoyl-tripeptide--D-alanyl-D-alanine ligase [Bacillaceae bacterium IKA-2]
MEVHSAGQLKQLLNGEIVVGREDLLVTDAVSISKHIFSKDAQHLLVFLKEKKHLNWQAIDLLNSAVVITDQYYRQFDKLSDCTIILVKNIEEAYWKFVNYYHDRFEIPIIAVTGTSGKTTVKEMIKHILQFKYKVNSTVSSFNNVYQSFNYLVGIDDETEVGVFETAVGRPGDVTKHCKYFRPSIGIITNIGEYHLDLCKTVDRYIEAKAELVNCLNSNGVLLLNSDDEKTKKISLQNFHGKVIYFGLSENADYRASDIIFRENGMESTLHFDNKEWLIVIPSFGEHQVYNALTAIAAVHTVGVEIAEAIERLKSYQDVERHLEQVIGLNGATIIDDTWNMNPVSLKAAIKVLGQISSEEKAKKVIIGDMKKLADRSLAINREIGQIIAGSDIDTLVTIGEISKEISVEAELKGFKGKLYTFAKYEDIYSQLNSIVNSESIVLVKGIMGSKDMAKLTRSLRGNRKQD